MRDWILKGWVLKDFGFIDCVPIAPEPVAAFHIIKHRHQGYSTPFFRVDIRLKLSNPSSIIPICRQDRVICYMQYGQNWDRRIAGISRFHTEKNVHKIVQPIHVRNFPQKIAQSILIALSVFLHTDVSHKK